MSNLPSFPSVLKATPRRQLAVGLLALLMTPSLQALNFFRRSWHFCLFTFTSFIVVWFLSMHSRLTSNLFFSFLAFCTCFWIVLDFSRFFVTSILSWSLSVFRFWLINIFLIKTYDCAILILSGNLLGHLTRTICDKPTTKRRSLSVKLKTGDGTALYFAGGHLFPKASRRST